MFTGGHHARTASAMSGVMVERACLALQSTQEKQVRDQAEQFLVSFRSSSSPYSIAKHVLDKSMDSSAQFHAVAAYREGLLREWGLLDPRQIEGLRMELFTFATNRGSSLAPFVANQLLQCICVIFKRDFLRNPQLLASTLLAQLSQLMASSQPSQRVLAVSLCAALINEFSSSHSSSIGVNIQFHDNCHEQFEKLCLPSLTSLLLSTLQSQVSSKEDKFLASLSQALQAVLNWDFTEDKPHSWTKEDTGKLSPPPDSSWQSVFFGPLLDMLATLQSEEIRDCIVQCCCLQGAILDTLPPANKLQYFSRLITRCVEPLLVRPASDEMGKKDVSLMLKRLFTNPSFGISSLLALPQGSAFIMRIVEHTCGVIRVGAEMAESVSLTLEAWCDMLQLAKASGPAALEKLQMPQLCLVIFKQFVEQALASSLSAQRDADEKVVWTQQFGSVGKIGRVNAQTSLSLLRDLIVQRASLLSNAKQLPASHLPKIQSELAVLLSILQSFLEEKREVTEKVYCPLELLQLLASNPNVNIVLEVINIIKVLGSSILFNCPEASKGVAGSHLLQSFLGVLSCFAFAYLSGTLPQKSAVSEGTAGHTELFQFIVTCLASCLESAHEQVREMCVELVEGMIESGASTCLSTVAASAWWHIVQRWETIRLPDDTLRRLVTSICVGCAEGNAKVKGTTSYRDGLAQLLVRPMLIKLPKVLSSPTTPTELSRTLSVARGIACASATRNAYPLLNEFMSSCLPFVVAALSRQSSPQVVLLLLQLIQANAEFSVAFLKEAEMWKFCELILQAIDSWVNFNSRRSLTVETEGEQASEIEALLVTIAGVVCKEAIDKSGDKFSRPTFPSEFALLALNRILPSFSTTLLLFPVVISNYFEILEVILQVHPELFAAMDGPSRVTMIESAKFAILSNSEEIVITSGLSIARSIVRFHYEAVMNSSKTPFAEDVQALSRCLVKFMSENVSRALLEPLADALLPLLLLDAAVVMRLTLQQLTDPAVERAFAGLASGLTRELSVANEMRFRADRKSVV